MSTRQGILIQPWVRLYLSLIGEVTIPIALTSKPCEFESRSGEVYLIQHWVIKFVSDLRHVCGFLQVLQFSPPIKLTTMI